MTTLEKLYKFNEEYVDPNRLPILLEVLKANEDDLDEAIVDIDKWRPKFNVKELFYKLKRKFEKRFKVLEYSEGVQAYVVANISDKTPEIADATQTPIFINNIDTHPLAYIVIKDYIRLPKFQDKIRRFESLLKRSNVAYIKTKAYIDGVHTVKFQTTVLDDNERFWGTLNLLTKG